jgi:hypothetical protein
MTFSKHLRHLKDIAKLQALAMPITDQVTELLWRACWMRYVDALLMQAKLLKTPRKQDV